MEEHLNQPKADREEKGGREKKKKKEGTGGEKEIC